MKLTTSLNSVPAEEPRRAVPVGVVQLGDEPPLLRRLGHRLHLRVQLGQVSLRRRLGGQLLRPLPGWQDNRLEKWLRKSQKRPENNSYKQNTV